MGKQSWAVALLIVLIHALAHWVSEEFGIKELLGVASIATGILVFLFLLSWGRWPKHRDPLTLEATLRAAIAGGIVAQYLSIVGTVALFSGREPESMNPTTQAFVSSFTTVVTVVIAFYFGTSAYVEMKKANRGGTTSDDD